MIGRQAVHLSLTLIPVSPAMKITFTAGTQVLNAGHWLASLPGPLQLELDDNALMWTRVGTFVFRWVPPSRREGRDKREQKLSNKRQLVHATWEAADFQTTGCYKTFAVACLSCLFQYSTECHIYRVLNLINGPRIQEDGETILLLALSI